jgi:hypothetical protein
VQDEEMKARCEVEWFIMLAPGPRGKPKVDDFHVIYLNK